MKETTSRDLEIKKPCSMAWSELRGGGDRRFCDECSLHVVDGSAMTRTKAKELVVASDGGVCMRLELDDAGQIVHADDTPRPGVVGRVLRFGLTAAAGVLAACGEDRAEPGPIDDTSKNGGDVGTTGTEGTERPREILGDVCYPEPERGEVMGFVGPNDMGAPQQEPQEEPQQETQPETPQEPREKIGKVTAPEVIDQAPGTEPKEELRETPSRHDGGANR